MFLFCGGAYWSPQPGTFLNGDESENVSQSDVSVDEVIKHLNKINGASSAAPSGFQLSS